MRSKAWWSGAAAGPGVLALLAAALATGGCEQPAMKSTQSTPAVAETAPGDPPVPGEALPAGATQPQTAPADTQPANAFLTVGGKIMEFPPAKLRLTKSEEGVTALLYSDDPPNATSPGYAGNGFYFEFPLRVADPEGVHGGEYWYKADDSEPSESPNGIFLQGTRYHLQPQDLAIKFDGEGRQVMAQLVGRFLVVGTSDHTVPGRVTTVQGTLYTTAEVKEQR